MRCCSECKEDMTEGFMVNGGYNYFCSEKCLHVQISPEEWKELSEEEDSESFWTTFDDEDDEE